MPYMNIAVILIAGMIAYIWSSRGLFSAFMHMLCVIVAGALAFAVWEPLALWMLSSVSAGGDVWADIAWGVSLGVPFALILLVLRIACDKLLPFNLDFDTTANVVGGLVCGAVSGTIAAGMVVMSVGYMRMESNILNYQRIEYGKAGGLERTQSLWFPADTLTAMFYSSLSNGSLAPPNSEESLGRLHPDLADENWLLRMTWEEGKGRNTIAPDAFEVISHYTYTTDDPTKLMDDHVNDDPKWTEARPANPQNVTYIDGKSPDVGNSYIEGFGITFKSGAKEQSGKVILGAGQVRLVVQKGSDTFDTMAVHPIAVVSQADNRAGEALKNEEYGRWRLEGSSFIPSAKEGNDTFMGFEFVVPKGSHPIALYVKGVRYDVPAGNAKQLTSQADHDNFIKTKAVKQRGGGGGGGSQGTKPSGGTGSASNPFTVKNWDSSNQELRITKTLPLGTTVQKDILAGLVIDETRAIIGCSGVAKFAKADLAGFGTDPKLQVRDFAVNEGSSVIQIRVDGKNSNWGLLSTAAAGADPTATIALADVSGSEYSPIGYVYKNATNETWIYFNPQNPIMSITDKDMPRMTNSRPDQELILVFWISKGTKLAEFKVGDKVIAKFDKPIEVK